MCVPSTLTLVSMLDTVAAAAGPTGATRDPRIEMLMAMGATEVRAATFRPALASSLACARSMSLTQFLQDQASTALEAADGDMERAANMIF